MIEANRIHPLGWEHNNRISKDWDAKTELPIFDLKTQTYFNPGKINNTTSKDDQIRQHNHLRL